MKWIACAMLAACLVGCSDDSDTENSDPIEKAAQAYSDAYLTGDADTAYALLTERCQARMAKDDFMTLVEAASQTYGDALPFETFSADINGDQARVTYTFTLHEIDQTDEPWVKESGDWHEDDC